MLRPPRGCKEQMKSSVCSFLCVGNILESVSSLSHTHTAITEHSLHAHTNTQPTVTGTRLQADNCLLSTEMQVQTHPPNICVHRNTSTYLHVCTCTQTHFTHTWTQSHPQSPTYTRRHGYRANTVRGKQIHRRIRPDIQTQADRGRRMPCTQRERHLYTRTHSTISHLSARSQTHYDTQRSIHIQGNTHTHTHIRASRGCKHTLPAVGQAAHLWFGNVTSDITGFAAHVSPRPPASQVTEHALEWGLSQVFREGGRYPPPHRELRAEGLRG